MAGSRRGFLLLQAVRLQDWSEERSVCAQECERARCEDEQVEEFFRLCTRSGFMEVVKKLQILVRFGHFVAILQALEFNVKKNMLASFFSLTVTVE